MYIDLPSIFFHEIMVYYTSLINQAYDLKTLFNAEKNKISKNEYFVTDYPYIGFRSNKKHSKSLVENSSLSIRGSSKIFFKNRKKVSIMNSSLDNRIMVYNILKEGYAVQLLPEPYIFTTNIEKQLKIIEKFIKRIIKKYKLPELSYNFFHTLKKACDHLYINPIPKLDINLLITGTLTNIRQRLYASHCLYRDIPVLCIAHGEESGTSNVQWWGYGDRSFSSYYLGYGSGGSNVTKDTYLKSLNKAPIYFESNSNLIFNNYKTESIPQLENLDGKKIIYVPTNFIGKTRMGPFYGLPDKVYFEWQKYLLDQFKTLLLKPHPKNRVNHKIPINRQISGSLEKCVQESDVIFIDSLGTTAFAIIASSSKPIIYFNIGIGNLTKHAENLIRQRCLWIDIDLNHKKDIINNIKNKLPFSFVNKYSAHFSLTSQNELREKTAMSIVSSILK
jgi:hypothetical protein